MNGSLRSVRATALLCVLSLFFTACGGSQTSLSSSTGTSETTTVDDSTPAGTGESSASGTASVPDGFSTSTEFFIAVDTKTTYPFYSSVLNSHGTSCKITSGTTPAQDMYCVIEAPELALYHGGVQLNINTPAGMCAYTKVVPYWFYNYEVGFGPASIQLESNTIEDAAPTFRCGADGGGLGSCDGTFDEVTFKASTNLPEPVCKYDKTSQDGENCCFGSYNLTVTENITVSGVLTTTVTTQTVNWGGDKDKSACIGGQGKSDWKSYSKTGLPVAEVYETRTSSKPLRYVVTAPIKTVANHSNIPLVNYFSEATTLDPVAAVNQHAHTGFAPFAALTSNLPYYVEPITDRNGTRITPSGSPYYEVQCLNDAHETLHRIRMLVREWDTKDAYDSFVLSGTYSGTKPWDIDPAWLGGDEGADCSGLSPEICNDMQDADNFVFGQSGNDYSTGAGNKSERESYFPAHDYTTTGGSESEE
jgi:hypothetical protein